MRMLLTGFGAGGHMRGSLQASNRIGRRVGLAIVAVSVAFVVMFGALAPPERCPTVTVATLRSSASETVDWFARNQQSDGRWLYLYDAETAAASSDYNVIRHAGVAMGLYQAAVAGLPGALASADRGLAWAQTRLIERDGWAAVSYRGETPVGASALLLAGLVDRRAATGDRQHDDLMQRLGRFLVAQTEPSGAVLAYYDSENARPVPGQYSKYYTGEAYWALARLHRLFPGGPWGEASDRVGSYLAGPRDDAEGYWPPVPDHWAAYGLAETAAFPERSADAPLTGSEVAYGRRQAQLFGGQVLWVSQRFGPWGALVRGSPVPRGGGYGVIGEALTGLWLVAEAEPRLADLRTPIAERAVCNAGLAVQAQASASDASSYAEPDRVRGAWLLGGETRMDDQQHALAALLRTVPIVEATSIGAAGSRSAPSEWLWFVALLAAINPARAAFGVPRGEGGRRAALVAALGGVAGAAVVLALALVSGPFAEAVDVSDPALRIAAGVIGAVVGATQLVRRPPSAEPALPGLGAAIVPVAIPLVISPGLLAIAVGAHADHGGLLVAGALAVGVALLVTSTLVTQEGPAGRVLAWAARITAAALLATSVVLVVAGIFDV